MCLGMFMAILDVQVVATSLPTIQSVLNIDPDQMSWIQTAYLIAEVVAIPLTGFLTRVLTMRWLFVVSLTVFVIASAGCAASAASASSSVGACCRALQRYAHPVGLLGRVSPVPENKQALATTIAAFWLSCPDRRSDCRRWLTESYSWHWLFLINILPGILAAGVALTIASPPAFLSSRLRSIDGVGLMAMAISLVCLEIGLKEAPTSGWLSITSGGLFFAAAISAALFIWRSLGIARPLVDLHNFQDRNFLVGSTLSFVLGIGLFGSVYLMPVFLAFVRGHNALEIGMTMLVTGIAQLLTAPIAVALEKRMDPRLLSATASLFSPWDRHERLAGSGTDYDAILAAGRARNFDHVLPLAADPAGTWQSLARPCPGRQWPVQPHAKLGGAIGIALIDTVIYTRSEPMDKSSGPSPTRRPRHCEIRWRTFGHGAGHQGPFAEQETIMLDPLVQTAATVQALNEAWIIVAVITLLAVLCFPFARRSATTRHSAPNDAKAWPLALHRSRLWMACRPRMLGSGV